MSLLLLSVHCTDEGEEGSEDDEGVCYISVFSVVSVRNYKMLVSFFVISCYAR